MSINKDGLGNFENFGSHHEKAKILNFHQNLASFDDNDLTIRFLDFSI